MRIVLMLFSLLYPIYSYSCPAQQLPQDLGSDSGRHDKIFLGEVVGLVLTGYIREVINAPDGYYYEESDTTPMHTLTVLVSEVIRGDIQEKTIVFDAGGCGIMRPGLRKQGLFFLDSTANRAIPFYDYDTTAYNTWLKKARRASR